MSKGSRYMTFKSEKCSSHDVKRLAKSRFTDCCSFCCIPSYPFTGTTLNKSSLSSKNNNGISSLSRKTDSLRSSIDEKDTNEHSKDPLIDEKKDSRFLRRRNFLIDGEKPSREDTNESISHSSHTLNLDIEGNVFYRNRREEKLTDNKDRSYCSDTEPILNDSRSIMVSRKDRKNVTFQSYDDNIGILDNDSKNRFGVLREDIQSS